MRAVCHCALTQEVGVFVGYFVPRTTNDRRRVFATGVFRRRAVDQREKITLNRPDSKHYRLAASISQISSEMWRELDVTIAFPSGEIANG